MLFLNSLALQKEIGLAHLKAAKHIMGKSSMKRATRTSDKDGTKDMCSKDCPPQTTECNKLAVRVLAQAPTSLETPWATEKAWVTDSRT
jgi:hypothetical protein